MPNSSSLVKKKIDYDTKITDIEKNLTNNNHDNYVATPEFNTLTANVFDARLPQANLITKIDFNAKLSILNRKQVLVENELQKLKNI